MRLTERIANWLKVQRRMFAIYSELGYVPWRKPAAPRKRKKKDGVYMGGRELIPFINEDGKRTISHLLFRPGYMMRDYIIRGDHEHYLAPFTALLVFFSVLTLLLAVVKPGAVNDSQVQGRVAHLQSKIGMEVDSTKILEPTINLTVSSKDPDDAFAGFMRKFRKLEIKALILTNLDKFPEEADKPWEQSLAAIESDLRSKGVPMFLGSFLLWWLLLWTILRKYQIGFSGAAAVSAYFLCQCCVARALLMLFSWGQRTELTWVMYAILLAIDYHQLLGIPYKKAIGLTVKTGLRIIWYGLLLSLLSILLMTLGATVVNALAK